MAIEIEGRDIIIYWYDYTTNDEVKDLVRYAIDIIQGGMNFCDDHYVWNRWKEVNCKDNIQAMLMFEKVFLPRLLLATTNYFIDYGGHPCVAC
jgi:hypothetical protein